jgi:fatty-acyl-CoA synthase
LDALERKYGSADAVRAALARHPRNRLRAAHGNGAPAGDRAKLVEWLGMEHVYELYGSTEAVINSVVRPGDPLDSVGSVADKVVILGDDDRPCPPATVDDRGQVTNYGEAVGEICAKVRGRSLAFDGYFRDESSTAKKYRDGYYHSGDLGHVRVVRGRRYLYFDGRTDDWIRKDGENFSAESVARFVRDDPSVERAAAYGVPAPVSDELVAVALELRAGATFDPAAFHDHLLRQQRDGGMDPKWMPDFVRIVDAMPITTGTDKVLVRQIKREGYDLSSHPDLVVYARRRGDSAYRRFTPADFEALREQLVRNGREKLLPSATRARA